MGHGTHEDLLARLLDKVASLEESNARLATRVRTLEGGRDHRNGSVLHDDEPVSRRGLLKKAGSIAVAGVAGAAVGNALGVAPAGAANGDPVIVGRWHDATLATGIVNGSSRVSLVGADHCVEGIRIGGVALSGNAYGTGVGVVGRASEIGTGVRAEANSSRALALEVKGKAKFSRSGTAPIQAGQWNKIIPGVPTTRISAALALLQDYVPGLWVQGVVMDPTNDRLIIGLNKATPRTVWVGWFVAN